MKEVDGEVYLELKEVTTRYGYVSSTLYLFRQQGLLSTYKFVGDRKAYWKVSEIEALQKVPPVKRDPKDVPVTTFNPTGTSSFAVVGSPVPITAS